MDSFIRVLHIGAWVTTLLGTSLRIQDNKKVKFSKRDTSSLAIKGFNLPHKFFTLH